MGGRALEHFVPPLSVLFWTVELVLLRLSLS